MSAAVVYAGAVAPEAYVLVLTASAASGIDLSTVTAASLKAKKAGVSTPETWTCTFAYDADEETLTLTHVFGVGELAESDKGLWSVRAYLTVPAGTIRSKPRRLEVRGEFDL